MTEVVPVQVYIWRSIIVYEGTWENDHMDAVNEYTRSLTWRSLKEIAAKDATIESDGP